VFDEGWRPDLSGGSGEFDALARLASMLPAAPAGETWMGDDTAVVAVPEGARLLLAADAVVAGVHADLSLTGLDDLGWKALVANLSDVAAMGGRPGHALVTVAGPPQTDLGLLYRGIIAAAARYRCPVVGGDLTNAAVLVVSISVTGWAAGPVVLRRGARPGDGIWVTGPLGRAAAGLRILRARAAAAPCGPDGRGAGIDEALMAAHARPVPALAEGEAAAACGATAMIDVSDGLVADLGHIAESSGIGFELEEVPCPPGVFREEALGGGEDYELAFCAPDDAAVVRAFAGLRPPMRIGTCVEDPALRSLAGQALVTTGWQHDWC